MAIKLADTLAPMADFPAVMAEHTAFEDGETLQEKYETGQLGGGGGGYTQLSQAEYDALTEDEKMNGKEYRTYDTGHIYKLGIEYGKDAYFTSLAQLGLTAPTTVGEVFVAMPDKSMLMLNVENVADANVTITDAPHNYGLLTIEKHSNARFRIEFSNSLGGNVTTVQKWIGILKGNDGTGLRWIELTGSAKIYTTMAQLGLDGATATVQDVMDAISVGETAMLRSDAFNNNNWQTQCNGIQYGYLKIEKTMNNLSNIELQEVVAPNRRYFGTQASGKFAGWTQATNARGLVSNAQNFKLDLTKNNAAWYGMFTFNFVYGTTPCEITVTITDKVYYTITKGQNLVSAITYTQDGANYQIGIDFIAKMYGTQVIDMPSEFGTINSLTAEQFTGDTSATFKGYDAKPITELTDLGLDGSATIQNIMDAMTIGQHCIINTSRFDDKTEVNNIEYGKVEIRRLSSGMWSLWLEDVLHGNVVAHGTCSASKFAGWQYLASKDYVDNAVSNSGNTFNGKEVKSITIDLSASAFQVKGTSLYKIALDNYISANTNVIKVEGYYVPPTDANSTYKDKRYIVHTSDSDRAGGIRYYDGSWTTCVCQSESGSKKGSGYAKIYYIN